MTDKQAMVSVPKAALDDFIKYADGLRSVADSQFCAGQGDYNASDREFREMVVALGLDS